MIKYKHILGMSEDNPYENPKTAQKSIKLPSLAAASQDAAAAGNEGNVYYDLTGNTVKISDGASWTDFSTTAGVGTLQQVTTAGKTSNVTAIKFTGASSNANRLEVGDGTRLLGIYGDGTDLQVVVPVGDLVMTAADDIKLVPTGGDVSVTGNVDMTGTLHVDGVSTLTGGVVFAGSFGIGSDGAGVDASFYTLAAGDSILWDASEKTLYSVDCKIHLSDSDELCLGTGSAVGEGDFKIYSDGTHLYIAAEANVADQALYLGDDTNDIDVIWEGDTASAIFQMDASTNQIELNGADMRLQDNDILHFGDGATTNGDFSLMCDGTDLFLSANATTADQALKIGDSTGTNDMDIIWYGLTSGDLVKFDSSDDSVLFTDIDLSLVESGTEQVLQASSACTAVDAISFTCSGALTDNLAALHVFGTGNIALGGAVCILEVKTGTPVEDSRILEIVGAGKLARGIYADVDPVANDAYVFHSGGATVTGKSVMRVSADGVPAAATTHILEVDGSSGTWGAVNCVPFSVLNSGAGACAIFENTVTGALGSQIILQHNPAAEANDDVACRIQFIGSDSAHADESAGRIDVVMRDETAADPDFDMIFYVDVAGTETDRLELNDYGVSIVDGILTTESTTDLVLNTNHGTNSGILTLYDAANGNLVFQPNGTGIMEIKNTDTGALGAVLNLKHENGAGLEANDDVIARIAFLGKDDADASMTAGRIDCVVRDVSDATGYDTDILFYNAVNDTETLAMELNGYGLTVGSGAATAYVTSAGARNIVLNANAGTDSGSITIAGTAAAGNITITPNTTGRVAITGPALANGTAHSAIAQIRCMPYVAGSFNASDDLVLFNANSPKMKVIDVWVDNDTAEGLAATLTLRDAAAGAGNVIATAIDINATTSIRAATLTTSVLAANSSVIAHASVNPGTCVGTVYVSFIEVA